MEKQAQTQLVAAQPGLPPRRTTWQCLSKLNCTWPLTQQLYSLAFFLRIHSPKYQVTRGQGYSFASLFIIIKAWKLPHSLKGGGGGCLAKLSWEEWLTFIECLLHTRQCPKPFTSILSFNPPGMLWGRCRYSSCPQMRDGVTER